MAVRNRQFEGLVQGKDEEQVSGVEINYLDSIYFSARMINEP